MCIKGSLGEGREGGNLLSNKDNFSDSFLEYFLLLIISQ
jgi:hypothetical protein